MARRFFFGTFFADTITGNDGWNFISSGSGDDYIDARGGSDIIFAGRGNDTVLAGSGNDYVSAGSGDDTVYGGSGNDTIFGGSGNDFLDGGAGRDYLNGGSGLDMLFGGDGNDRLFGGAGDDGLNGGAGNDWLIAGSGDDTIMGGDGADVMFGYSGDDIFLLSPSEETGGRDYVSGGRGIDTIVLNLTAAEFASQDVADDLNALLDFIDARKNSSGQVFGRSLTLSSLNLRVRNVEIVRVFIDGVEVDPRDAGPDTGGGNDPIAVDDDFFVLEGDSLSDSVLTNDTADAGTTVTLISGVTQGTLVLNDDGTFAFDAGEDFDALAAGETDTVSFTYALSGGGSTNQATATITITGTNDAPIVSAPLTAIASEGGAAVVVNLLAGASDVDNGAILTAVLPSDLPAGVSVNGAALTFDPTDPAYDSLAEGETLDLVITYAIEDGEGGSVPQTLTLTLTGTNDAPSVAAALSAAADENGAAVTLDLLTGASDVDNGAVLAIANVAGLVPGLNLTGTTLSVDPNDNAFESLAAGDVLDIVITYDVVDEFGASTAQTATISITGTNDAPTVGAALTASATEGDRGVSVDLLDGAADVDTGTVLTAVLLNDLPSGISLSGNVLTLNPDDIAFNGLAAGEVRVITIDFEIRDGDGGSVPQSVTFTITGTNDAPTASAAISASAAQGTGALTLDLLQGADDVDGDTLSIDNLSALPDGVSVTNGVLTVDTDNPAFAGLGNGESSVLTVTFDIVDGNGGSVARTATLTITGSNSGPSVDAALTAALFEDQTTSVDLLAGATDPDGDPLSVINLSALPAGVTLSGTTLSVDASDPAYQALANGETLDLIVTYQITDGSAAPVDQSLTITITGTNDAPTVGAAITAGASEDDAGFTVDLLAGASDVDNGDTLSVTGVSALPAGVTLIGNSLSVDPSDASFKSLAVGETQDIVVTYFVTDAQGATTPQTATITITGTNDAPTVTTALSGAVLEGDASVSFDLLDGAADVDASDGLSIANVSALPSGVTLVGSTLTFDPTDPAYDSLAVGDVVDLTITFDIEDGQGGSVAQTLTLSVSGTNDVPTVSGALTAAATEGGAVVSIDLLDGASDVDAGTELSLLLPVDLPAGMSVTGTTLAFDPTDAAYDALAAGETLDLVVEFAILDGDGGSVPQTLTVTVTGTNDAPTVAAALTAGAVEGDTAVSVNLLDGASDVDNGATLSAVVSGALPAGVSVTGNALTFDPANAAYDSLAVGETQDIVIDYVIEDGEGGSVAQTLTITVTGTNDAPTVTTALSGAVLEGDASVSFDLLDGAGDVDATDMLSVANVSALPAGVTLVGSTLTFDPTHPAYDSLAVGDFVDLTITFDIEDGQGGSVAQTLTISVSGTNDVPTVSGALTAAATEGGAVVSIDLLDGASDVDAGTELSLLLPVDLPAGMSVTGTTLSFDPTDAAYDALAAGETLDLVVDFAILDGDGGSVPQTLTVTVTGTNDAPTVGAAITAGASEDDASFTVDLLAGASDVDNGDTLSVTGVSALPAGVTLIGNSLSVDPSDASFQSLAVGETQDIVVTYFVTDAQGATTPQTATITITGTNDAPVGDFGLSGSVAEASGETRFDLLDGATDVDASDTLSVINVAGLVPGVTQVGNELVVDANHAEFDSLAAGQSRNIVVTYVVADGNGGGFARAFTLTVTGTNDSPSIAGELGAEANEDDAIVTLDLLDGAFDVDNGDVLSVTNVVGLVPGLTLTGSTLSIDPSDAEFQSLSAGQQRDIVITYDVTDGTALTAQTAVITITGTNDVPVVTGANTSLLTEDTGVQTVDLLSHVSDVDALDVLSVSNLTGLVPGVTFNAADGTVSVDTNAPAFADIAQGQTREITLTFDVEDGQGGVVATSATITVQGTNDAPIVSGPITATISEDAGFQSYDLLSGASDVDLGAVLSVSLVEADLPDGFALDADGQTLVFRPWQNADAQALADGETLDITVDYQVVDEFGASVDQSVVITVTGVNDAPRNTIGYAIQQVDFDEAYSLVLPETQFFDAEGDALTLTATLSNGDPLPSWLTFDAATGTLSGTPTATDGGGLVVRITADDGNDGVGMLDIRFAIGDGLILGTDGDDTLNGTTGNDTFIAGLGADIMFGGRGEDVYVFNVGDGQDIVRDFGFVNQTDAIVFTGYNLADASFERVDANDFRINFANGDSVLVDNSLNNTGNVIERLEFVDGVMTETEIRQAVIDSQITDGDDLTQGTIFNDIFTSSLGDDNLQGGRGLDTYIFGTNFGADTIFDSGFIGETDTVIFTDYTLADATIERLSFDDFRLTFANGDSVTFDDGINSTARTVEVYQFADQTLTIEQMRALIIDSQATDSDDTVLGTIFNDTINGGLGNDQLEGSRGSDTYVFDVGGGQDTILDSGFIGQDDTLIFTGYNIADATFERVNFSDFRIVFANGDSVTIDDGVNSTSRQIEFIQFQDGTLDIDQILAAVLDSQVTSGDDFIQGTIFNDTLIGGLGNDRIEGARGSDLYVFNSGDGQDTIFDSGFNNETDTLRFTDYDLADATFVRDSFENYTITFANGDSVTIENGLNTNSRRIEVIEFADQTLDFDGILATLAAAQATDGDDTIFGTRINDTLEGGLGNDTLIGSTGQDIYIFNQGDGQDLIQDFGSNGEIDQLVFTDYNFADATFSRPDITLLQIEFANGDRVQIENGIDFSGGREVEQFVFADQTVNLVDLRQAIIDGTQTDDDDTVYGYRGIDDVIDAGLGNDILRGRTGEDTYVYTSGDGMDEVFDVGSAGETDTIQFTDYALTDATFTRVDTTSYRIDFGGGDSVFVRNGLFFNGRDIEVLQFTDATIGMTDVAALILASAGTAGDDTINGFNDADDILQGLGGDDLLSGFTGEDTYVFSTGDGQDVVRDRGRAGETDTLQFTDRTLAEAAFSRSGDQLIIDFANGDQVRADFALQVGGSWEIEQYQFTDQTIDQTQLLAILDGLQGTSGDDVITGQFTDETFNGGAGNDTIAGAGGNDLINTGTGIDTVLFAQGDGQDVIANGDGGFEDTLIFSDYASSDATVTTSSGDLVISFANGDSVTITDGAIDGSGDIQTVRFTDGDFAPASLIVPVMGMEIIGTDASETLTGTDGDDTLIGGLGNDQLEGGAGDDTYVYAVGDGNDIIFDSAGNDTLILEGLSSFDVFALAGIEGGAFLDIRDPLDPFGPPVGTIELGDGAIETFVFIPDPENPEITEVLTFDELFEGGPIGPPVLVAESDVPDVDLFG